MRFFTLFIVFLFMAASASSREIGFFKTVYKAPLSAGVPLWSLLQDSETQQYFLSRKEVGVEELIALSPSQDQIPNFPGSQLTFRAQVIAPDARTGQFKTFLFRVNYSEPMLDRGAPERSLHVQMSEGFFSWTHSSEIKHQAEASDSLYSPDYEHCLDFGARKGWQLCFEEKLTALQARDRKAQDIEAFLVGPGLTYTIAATLEATRLKVSGKPTQFAKRLRIKKTSTGNDGHSPMGNVFGTAWQTMNILFDKASGEAVGLDNLKIPVQADLAPKGPQYSVLSSRAILRTEIYPSDLTQHKGTAVDRSLGLSISTYELTAQAKKQTPFTKALLMQTRNASYLVGLLDIDKKKQKATHFVGELITYSVPLQAFVRQRFVYNEAGSFPTLRVIDLFDYGTQAVAQNLFSKTTLPLNFKPSRLNSSLDAPLGIVNRDTFCAPWTDGSPELICLIRKDTQWLFYVGNPATQNFQLFPLELDTRDIAQRNDLYRVKQRHLWLNLPRMELMSVDGLTNEVRFRISEQGGVASKLEIINVRTDLAQKRDAHNPLRDQSKIFTLQPDSISKLSLCEAALVEAQNRD